MKKLDSIHKEGIRIYTGTFRTSIVEFQHVEAKDPPLGQRRNELVLRFLCKLRSNTAYIESLDTLDDRDDQNYENKVGATKPMGVHLRRLKWRHMEEQKEIEEMSKTQQLLCLVNNIFFCYEGGMTTWKNNISYNSKKHREITNKPIQMGQRVWERR